MRIVWALVCLAGLLLPTDAWATNPGHGARAAAMGTAFVAIADDPSAIVHNPAGQTTLEGTRIYGGGSALTIGSTYESPQGQSERTHFRVYFPPQQFLMSDFGLEKVVFGLGVYSPFGIGGRTWSDDGLTHYVSTQSLVSTFPVNPTFAWRPLPDLLLGFGLDHVYAIGKAKRKINQSALGAPDGGFEFNETFVHSVGFRIGYRFGEDSYGSSSSRIGSRAQQAGTRQGPMSMYGGQSNGPTGGALRDPVRIGHLEIGH